MVSSIFVIDAQGQLTEVSPSSFAKELDFQMLIASHPELLRPVAGADGDLLLVSQEFGIADEEDGSDRWCVDHLFLSPDGLPVLVEVKRASDTRTRREVVAQMLGNYPGGEFHGAATGGDGVVQRRLARSAGA